MAFDKKLAVEKYGEDAKVLCADLGVDPNVTMTHVDHVFECLTCIAPRWQHVAHRLYINRLIREAVA